MDYGVVLVRPEDTVATVQDLGALIPGLRTPISIPLLYMPSDSPVEAIVDNPGVAGVEIVDEWTMSILEGFDRIYCLILGLNDAWGIGGVRMGENYPYAALHPRGTVAGPAVVAAVNLSIAPDRAEFLESRDNDSVNHVTRWLSSSTVPVVAAGNFNRPNAGFETLSPWAEPSWVLSVGATVDKEGLAEAPYSSRGVGYDPGSGPDILAWGQSVTGPMKGTTYAAARVSRYIALAQSWLLQVRANLDRQRGQPFGVPLVGVAVVDRDFSRDTTDYSKPILGRAQPVLRADGLDADVLETYVDEMSLPETSRFLVEAAASATSPTGGLSAPSITAARLEAWLDSLTSTKLAQILHLLSTSSASPKELVFEDRSRPEPSIFDKASASHFHHTMLKAAMPIWEWEIPTSWSRMRHDLLHEEEGDVAGEGGDR